MAISYSCDGCGTKVTEPIKIGNVTKREYCEKCAEKAEAFIADEEQLRKDTHEKFIDDRAALIAKYSEGGFHLPDVR